MRAVVATKPGGPEVLQLTDLPIPEPGPGQVRLRVAYVGMNPLDAMARGGNAAWMGITFPYTPGLEYSGIVDALGEGVKALMMGQRVTSRAAFGGYADYALAPANTLVPLDDRIDLKTGAVYNGCSSTAWFLLVEAIRAQRGETALFHSAAGPVGIMLTQIAKSRGLKVIGLTGGPDKISYAKQFGADHLIDYLKDDWTDQVMAMTGGRGADIIVDGNAGPHATKNYGVVAPFGRVFFIGATAVSYPAAPEIPFLLHKSFSIGGFSMMAVNPASYEKGHAVIRDAVADGSWKVPVSEEVALENVADLHARLAARKIHGRAIIRVGGDIA